MSEHGHECSTNLRRSLLHETELLSNAAYSKSICYTPRLLEAVVASLLQNRGLFDRFAATHTTSLRCSELKNLTIGRLSNGEVVRCAPETVEHSLQQASNQAPHQLSKSQATCFCKELSISWLDGVNAQDTRKVTKRGTVSPALLQQQQVHPAWLVWLPRPSISRLSSLNASPGFARRLPACG